LIAGGFTFLDAKSRAELLQGGTLFGASIRADHFLLRRVGLEADISGGGGIQQVTINGGSAIPLAWAAVQVGASALVTWDWRWLSLWGGPRVTALWINRSFNLQAYQGSQSGFTVTPGVMVGGAVRLSSRLEIVLNVQTVLTVFPVDGKTQFLGFFGGFAGVGYRY
jgi:hypothetical protein